MDVRLFQHAQLYPARLKHVHLRKVGVGGIVGRGHDEPHLHPTLDSRLEPLVQLVVEHRSLVEIESRTGAVDQRSDARPAVDRPPHQQRLAQIGLAALPVGVEDLGHFFDYRLFFADGLEFPVLGERRTGQVVGHDKRHTIVDDQAFLVAETEGARGVQHLHSGRGQLRGGDAVGVAAAFRVRLDHHARVHAALCGALQGIYHVVLGDEIDLHAQALLRAVDGLHQPSRTGIRLHDQLHWAVYHRHRAGRRLCGPRCLARIGRWPSIPRPATGQVEGQRNQQQPGQGKAPASPCV